MNSEFLPWHSGYFWLSLAALLLIIEILTPTAIALGFAVGAIVIAVALFFEVSVLEHAIVLLLCWSISSLLSWGVLRRVFFNKAASRHAEQGDINE